jgi:Flp pilus assembly protein TadG
MIHRSVARARARSGRSRGIVRDTAGAAMVEFALILPFLLVLLFGIIEFARAWNTRQVLTDAAREGARVAVVRRGTGGSAAITQAELEELVRTTVQEAAARANLATDPPTMIITGDAATGVGGDPGTPAMVTVDYQYTPLFGTWVMSQSLFTLTTSFVMRNE